MEEGYGKGGGRGEGGWRDGEDGEVHRQRRRWTSGSCRNYAPYRYRPYRTVEVPQSPVTRSAAGLFRRLPPPAACGQSGISCLHPVVLLLCYPFFSLSAVRCPLLSAVSIFDHLSVACVNRPVPKPQWRLFLHHVAGHWLIQYQAPPRSMQPPQSRPSDSTRTSWRFHRALRNENRVRLN